MNCVEDGLEKDWDELKLVSKLRGRTSLDETREIFRCPRERKRKELRPKKKTGFFLLFLLLLFSHSSHHPYAVKCVCV